MKNRVITVLLILNLITTMGILNFFMKGQISKEKEILKEMSEVEYESEINNLNKSHTEYSNYIEESKRKIAKAINMYPNNNATEENSLEELTAMISNLTNIPENTYYYEKGTEGDSSTIVRYKKVDGNYYVCDANGIVSEGTSAADVSEKILEHYNAASAGNISAGFVGYASGTLYLGDGADNTVYYDSGFSSNQGTYKYFRAYSVHQQMQGDIYTWGYTTIYLQGSNDGSSWNNLASFRPTTSTAVGTYTSSTSIFTN